MKQDEPEREKQVKAVVIFGDMRGFGSFMQRVSHPQTQLFPFWRAWAEIKNTYQDRTGFFIKRLGDGIMAVAEVEDKNIVKNVSYALDETWDFAIKSQALIKNKKIPKPEDFRVRLTFDYIWKVPCRQFGFDYIADKVNLSEKMLHMEEDKFMICHESIKEIIPQAIMDERGYVFKKINVQEQEHHGIYNQDVKYLWTFEKTKQRI